MAEADMDFVFDNDGALPDLGFDFTFGALNVSGDALLPGGMSVGGGGVSSASPPPPPLLPLLAADETSLTATVASSTGTSEEEVQARTTSKNGKQRTTSNKTTTATTRGGRKKRTSRNEDNNNNGDEGIHGGDDDGSDNEHANATPHTPVRFVPSERRGNAFDFSKNELAVMTCQELDAYTAQVRAHHTPSAEEEALLKKYRRQIRNRECAQSMRARKRQQMDELSKTVDELKDEMRKHEVRADVAEREAASLRARVHYLEGLLKENNIPFQGGVASGTSGMSGTRKGLAVAATTTLFVFLFSVGLFMGPTLQGGSSGGDMPTVVPRPPPMGLASPSGDVKVYGGAVVVEQPATSSQQQQHGTGRQLFVAEGVKVKQEDTPAAPRYVTREQPREETRRSMRIIEKSAAAASSSAPAIKLSQLPSRSADADKLGLVESSMVRQHTSPSPFESKFDRPDTEYMYCPVAHHITSTHKPEEGHDGERFPPRVSIIVPGDAFNSSNLFEHMEGPPPLVEVTCSVVDIWPVFPVPQGHVSDK